jgi:hypothetical protein
MINGMSTLREVALAFARECLEQHDSKLIEGRLGASDRIRLLPQDFNLGSMDASSLHSYDLTSVMHFVSHWCALTDLTLTLSFTEEFDGGCYSCTIAKHDDDGRVAWLLEGPQPDVCYEDLTPCGDACYVLIAASLEAGRALKRDASRPSTTSNR